MVTVLAGPIDKLTSGLIAGMKIADQRNRTKVLRERNQMLTEQLLMQQRRHQQQDVLNTSTIAANDSRISLDSMRTRALEEGIDSKNQDQTEALASALADADDTPTLLEALDVVDTFAAGSNTFGIPLETQKDKEAFAQLIMASQSRESAARQLEFQKSDNIAQIQAGMLGVREFESIDPLAEALIDASSRGLIGVETQRVSLSRMEMGLDVIGVGTPEEIKTRKAEIAKHRARLNADEARYNTAIENAVKDMNDRRNSSTTTAAPGTSGGSLPLPTPAPPPSTFLGPVVDNLAELRSLNLPPNTEFWFTPHGMSMTTNP